MGHSVQDLLLNLLWLAIILLCLKYKGNVTDFCCSLDCSTWPKSVLLKGQEKWRTLELSFWGKTVQFLYKCEVGSNNYMLYVD